MKQQTLSELTILLLLLISSARVFFIHSERKDPLSIAPLVALVCSALGILAWGVWVQELVVLSISLWVFIWNFRALLRLNENLIVDHYSPLFILISSINCALTVMAIAFVFYFRPVNVNLKKAAVEKTVSHLSGKLKEGFIESEDFKTQKTLDFISYKPSGTEVESKAEHKGTILFLPSECASVDIYEPFLSKLARDGYTVYGADYYGDEYKPDAMTAVAYRREVRRFSFVRSRLSDSESYKLWCENQKEGFFLSMFDNMEKLIPSGEKLIVVGDGLPKDLYVSLIWKNERFSRCFDIASINDYKTPGWGPVEQTDPLLAMILGYPRDSALYTSNRTASVLEQMIEAVSK
ncbi:MAG: hypothetical protein IJU95_03100 [Treponema sp.]|nr:hypothetical protein [Treponema sp.]